MEKAIGWEGAGLQGIDLGIGSGYLLYGAPLTVSGVDVCVSL